MTACIIVGVVKAFTSQSILINYSAYLAQTFHQSVDNIDAFCLRIFWQSRHSHAASGQITEPLGVIVPANKVKAVDTTAAGDVYCGALAVALSEGKTLPEALSFATAASGIAVTRMGAQASAPSREEVDKAMEK